MLPVFSAGGISAQSAVGKASASTSAITKSGGNSFHGSTYEFFRTPALDARNFFNGATVLSVNRLLNIEFLNGIDGGKHAEIIEVLIRDRDAVQEVHVMATALSRDRHGSASLA